MNNGDVFPTFRTTAQIARRLWRWTRLFLAGMTCAFLLAYVVVNVGAGRALERQLVLVRQRGEPLNLAEVAPPPVPDRENAALVYEQAFRRLPRLESMSSSGGPNTPQQLLQADQKVLHALFADDPNQRAQVSLPQVRQVLAGADEALDLARQAAAMPRCRFPVDWEAGAGALLPHLPRLRWLGQLLGARAILSAADGDADASLADIEAIVGMSRHLGGEPILISQAIQYACLAVAGSSLRQILSLAPVGEAPARHLAQSLEQVDLQAPFARALLGERAFGEWAFDLARRDPAQLVKIGSESEGGGEGSGPLATLAPALRTVGAPLLKMDETFYLQYMTAQIDTARQQRVPPAGRRESDGVFPWFAVVSRIMTPAIDRAQNKQDQTATRLALARWALALNVYHQRAGHYPESSIEVQSLLGWSLPTDPFTGEPLAYRRLGNGYLLYSFGANGRDDGGENARYGPPPSGYGPPPSPGNGLPPRPASPLDTKDDITWRIDA